MLKDDDPGGGEYATTTGHLDSLCVPIPGNLPLKKNTNARGLALGGGGGGGMGTAGNDGRIIR